MAGPNTAGIRRSSPCVNHGGTRCDAPAPVALPCTMRRCLSAVSLVIAVALAGCAPGTSAVGSGDPASSAASPTSTPATPSGQAGESREVRGFTGVELTSFGDLQIEQTGTESLTIEAAPDVLPQLTSEVSGGVLRLGVAPGTAIRATTPVVYRLTVAALDSVAVSGAGDVTASNLQAGRLTAGISGAGDMTLSGTVASQVVTISGTGDYDGENLQSATAEIAVDGAGDAVVRVSSRLDVTIRGVGSVEYIGNPQVRQSIQGAGSVEQR
jgi:Putative auto-transporter adhesin, head GIN domain